MDGLGSASSPLFLFAGKEKEAKRKAAKALGAATDLHQIQHDLAALFRRETALLSEGFF